MNCTVATPKLIVIIIRTYPEQSIKTIVPCPLTISAASLKFLITEADNFTELAKQTKTLFLVRSNFLKSLASMISSITTLLLFFAAWNGTCVAIIWKQKAQANFLYVI